MKIESPDQFTIGLIIQFLKDNEMFAKYGFFKGFSSFIFNAIMSDPRQQSDAWFLSVIQKLLSYETRDPEFLDLVDRIIDKNFERFSQTALKKLVILVANSKSATVRYRDQIMRRVKLLSPESFIDMRSHSQFLIALAKIDNQKKEEFLRFFNAAMKH